MLIISKWFLLWHQNSLWFSRRRPYLPLPAGGTEAAARDEITNWFIIYSVTLIFAILFSCPVPLL
jgi:hypothetical protein